MQIEVIGYEEKRTVTLVGNELVAAKEIRRYLTLRFPDGSVEQVRTSRSAIDKFIASY